MTWDNAVAWAGGLSYYDTVRATTWDDWRLPSTVDTGIQGCPSTVSYSGADCGYNVLTGSAATTVYSEIASLWYDTLGNIARWDTSGNNNQLGWGLSNTGADGVNFMHLKGDLYWSAEYPLDTDDGRWKINTRTGLQRNQIKDNSTNFAWAVRSGDVAAVPEPGTVVLMALGLVGLGLGRRRRLAA
ncbi:MAG: PEP-CTERM sorting domain-containing protein [Proteobacteria bacterium]|nr:PEP-CTERM sorting domain-containing protein [Pseudomonadota bacterium]